MGQWLILAIFGLCRIRFGVVGVSSEAVTIKATVAVGMDASVSVAAAALSAASVVGVSIVLVLRSAHLRPLSIASSQWHKLQNLQQNKQKSKWLVIHP